MKINKLYIEYLNCNKVCIDSRKIEKNDIFFGLTGKNINGSIFANQAIKEGARLALVNDKKYQNLNKKIFYVKEVLKILQELSIYHRKKLKIPIFAITGSNGKTTTKELIASVMSQKFNIHCTQGNLNNYIGLPMTILSINKKHKFSIIEMGASHQGEIKFLANLCKPDIGYITNFGKAHISGFNNLEGVIKGKSELYDFLRKNQKLSLVNSNDIQQMKNSKGIQRILFGNKSKRYTFDFFEKNNQVGLIYKEFKLLSNLTGKYNFTNICAAVRLGFHFGISFDKIKIGIESYIPNNNRSQIKYHKRYKIIMDAYNANPSSMKVSITNFSNFQGEKCIILGDMFELGKDSEKEHRYIIKYAKKFLFQKYYFIGNEFFKVKINEDEFFNSKKKFIEILKCTTIKQKNILIKGSRKMALETICNYL